jgi:hypothetical protein
MPRSKMCGATPPLPQYVFMAWCLVKHRDDVTFTLLYLWEATKSVMAAKLTRLTQRNSDTTAPSGRVLYHLQFSLQAVSPESFGYILVLYICIVPSWNSIAFHIYLKDLNVIHLSAVCGWLPWQWATVWWTAGNLPTPIVTDYFPVEGVPTSLRAGTQF